MEILSNQIILWRLFFSLNPGMVGQWTIIEEEKCNGWFLFCLQLAAENMGLEG